MRIKLLFIPIVLLLILVGCSKSDEPVVKEDTNKEPNKESVESKETTKNDDADEVEVDDSEKVVEEESIIGAPLPTTLVELEGLLPGETNFLNKLDEEDRAKIDEMTAGLPNIENNPTNEELDKYYEAILSLFQQDFIGPEELINQMKFESIGNPDLDDPRMQFKENLNVMVILDASGSMGNYINDQTQMEAAKLAINNFVQGLPEEANVGLRIYGHKGTGSGADKEMSCNSSDIVYPIDTYDSSSFNAILEKVQPAGWTPTELALSEAQKDLAAFKGDKNTNIVYLVGDGISTCDDNPAAAAKKLYESDITPIVNVIGFNVDNAGQKQLKEIAEAAEGTYQDVQNAQGLQDELDQAHKVAENWKQWKTSKETWLNVDKMNKDLDVFGYYGEEFRKWVDERQQIGFVLTYLLQKKEKMSVESHNYLEELNISYHSWIEEEYDKLRTDLEALNEGNYKEAIETLENKYKQSTSTP